MSLKSGTELIDEAKARITEITPQDVLAMQARGEEAVYLDVREPNEWNLGHLPKAVHLPRGMLELKVEQVVPRERPVVVYCAGGGRSALAADTLQQMGYARVYSLRGGFRAWAEDGGDVEG